MDIKLFIKTKLQDYYKSRLNLALNNFNYKFDSEKFENMVLLFPVRGKNDMELLRKVAKQAKKESFNFKIVVYSLTLEMPDLITDRNLFVFNAGNFNYKWQPHSELKNWLLENPFDLLINFDYDGLFELVNMHNLLNAGVKVANQNEKIYFYTDLTININENEVDWEAFYTLAIQNIRMLKIKKNDTGNRSSHSNALQQERGNR